MIRWVGRKPKSNETGRHDLTQNLAWTSVKPVIVAPRAAADNARTSPPNSRGCLTLRAILRWPAVCFRTYPLGSVGLLLNPYIGPVLYVAR